MSYAILMIEANCEVGLYQERQRAVIRCGEQMAWLDLARPDEEQLRPLAAGFTITETGSRGGQQTLACQLAVGASEELGCGSAQFPVVIAEAAVAVLFAAAAVPGLRKMNPLLTMITVVAVAGAAWAGWELAGPRPNDLFVCSVPTHHDGDAIRCAGHKSMRLYAIDAAEMPGACRPGRECTPGDPFAARDHLRSLTRGREVECRIVDADNRKAGFQASDRYGRPIAQCFVQGRDLSCSMVAGRFAIERYGSLRC